MARLKLLPHIRRLSSGMFLLCAAAFLAGAGEADVLELRARSRTADSPYKAEEKALSWEAKKTAVIVCDMWDKHWCAGATRRVAEMAPRMNELAAHLRARGALIIHSPSDTMKFYAGTPQRKLAQDAPKVETAIALQRWMKLDAKREGKLPIDDSDGGCDCQPQCKTSIAWKQQTPVIEIKDGDAITESAEAYYLMKQRGITNVIVMGVHTNMCVLGRPFSIRQMVTQGQNVVLVRDLTDTMYNPLKAPVVSHFTGTERVIEHIEKFWCPTVTSDQFLGGKPVRFAEDKRKHIVLVLSETEYKTDKTVPEFAAKYLGRDFKVSFVFGGDEKEPNSLPGIEALNDADLALFSVRRRAPPKAQMDAIKKFVADGKPLIGIRTASHAFALRGTAKPPEGGADWPEFDAQVIGGNYHDHYGAGPAVKVARAPGAGEHPILARVTESFESSGSLYKTTPLAKSSTPLLLGTFQDKPAEPVAWTNTHSGGGAVFYTSLGHPDDFQRPAFRQLLLNAIYWAAKLPAPEISVE